MKMVIELPRARPLAANDLKAAVALQQQASAGLEAGFVQIKSKPELLAYLDGSQGSAFGIFERGELVAMALLRIPNVEHPNPGPPFPRVPAADWPLRATILENALVAPVARGRGHQRALLDARFERAASAGMRWACAGVHLGNMVSWRNLLAMGMVITGSRQLAGHHRLALLRSLDGSALRTDPDEPAWVSVAAQDAAAHHNALEAGCLGVRMALGGSVLYQRSLD